jgi:hypothetical protein
VTENIDLWSDEMIFMTSTLLLDNTQRWVVVLYRRFGTTYQSHLQMYYWIYWPLKMGPIGCPETSVHNCHSTLRNIQQERRSHLHSGGSLISRIFMTIIPPGGRAMAQAVSRRPLTTEARVRSQVKSMWDLWWAKWHRDRFFSELSVFPCRFHSTGAPLLVKTW